MNRPAASFASRIAVAVVGGAFVLGWSTPASAAPAVPGLQDSASIAGPVVASGTLLRSDGSAAGRGQLVTLEAWPTAATLARTAVGEAVKVVPVGFALTDSRGAFQLRYSDEAMARRYADPSGRVSLEVTAFADGVPSSYSLTGAAPDAAPLQVSASGGERDAQVPGRGANHAIELLPIPGAQRGVASHGGQKGCSTTTTKDYGAQWTTVGAGYSSIDVKMDFSYTSGASSELGVGVSASGSKGSFKQSGTSSLSNSNTIDFPTVSGSTGRFWKTQFNYKLYKTTCIIDGSQLPIITYRAKPSAYLGGSKTSTPERPPTATHCRSYEAGSSFTKSSSSAYTASSGVEIASAIGVSLSSKTGYSSDAKIKFVFNRTHNLCGTDDSPGGSPKRLVAKN